MPKLSRFTPVSSFSPRPGVRHRSNWLQSPLGISTSVALSPLTRSRGGGFSLSRIAHLRQCSIAASHRIAASPPTRALYLTRAHLCRPSNLAHSALRWLGLNSKGHPSACPSSLFLSIITPFPLSPSSPPTDHPTSSRFYHTTFPSLSLVAVTAHNDRRTLHRHRATSLSRKSTVASRNASLIKKNTGPHELRPSDILIERFTGM